jgi:hypothetical protein
MDIFVRSCLKQQQQQQKTASPLPESSISKETRQARPAIEIEADREKVLIACFSPLFNIVPYKLLNFT